MSFISRVWKDRKTKYPNRRVLTKENGTTELVTVSREEGIISEEGDAFSAENMNNLEDRIANEFDEVSNNLTAVAECLDDIAIVDMGKKSLFFSDGVSGIGIKLVGVPYVQIGAVLVNGYETTHIFAASVLNADPSNGNIEVRCVTDPTLSIECLARDKPFLDLEKQRWQQLMH